MKTFFLCFSFILLVLCSAKIRKHKFHRDSQTEPPTPSNSSVGSIPPSNSSVSNVCNISESKVLSLISLFENQTAAVNDSSNLTQLRNSYIIVSLFISQIKCYTDAGLKPNYQEIKNEIHRSIFNDYWNFLCALMGCDVWEDVWDDLFGDDESSSESTDSESTGSSDTTTTTTTANGTPITTPTTHEKNANAVKMGFSGSD